MAYKLYQYNIASITGSTFPIISAFDVNKKQKKVQLNPEKVYLIDYWASWCIPCVAKIPALKKLYAAYKSKGFEVISLSLDAGYDAWVNAIKKHQIPWENYSALNGFDAEDAKYFNVTAIPYTILVGEDNKIIKLNPREEEVEQYLKKQ
jgi:thiol-disulfide isomerase/thioredoxin